MNNEVSVSTEDYTSLEIYYAATLTQGSHTVNILVKDQKNNPSSITWSFSVDQPPKILSFTPANGATVVTKTPQIMTKVTSGNGIDPNSIVMTLNNAPVNATLDPVSGTISYQVTVPLTDETFYNVALSLKDTAGTPINGTWQFYINTFQEMAYSEDDSTCQKCHVRTNHKMNNCSKCHGVNLNVERPTYPVDNCYLCHFNSTNYPAVYHNNGLPLPNPPLHPVRITYSCTDCHNKTWQSGIPTSHNLFDTPLKHTTTTTGCTECHSTSLTREHQRRVDTSGSPLTCFTCHNSTAPNVQNAIANKDTSCATCHGAEPHHTGEHGCLDCHTIH